MKVCFIAFAKKGRDYVIAGVYLVQVRHVSLIV